MRPLILLLAIPTMLAACSPTHLVTYDQPAVIKWGDTTTDIQLSLSGGFGTPLVCAITIRNRGSFVETYPQPLVMPLAGDSNKNNVRILDSQDNLVPMFGVHVDWRAGGRPIVELGPDEIASFAFDLDYHFRLTQPGEYKLVLWYFSDPGDEATWDGRVDVEPIMLTVEKGPANSWLTGQ